MKILALTNLFPTVWDPLRASFNRQQFDRLAEHHDLEVLVSVDFRSRLRGASGEAPVLRHARGTDFTFWYPPRIGRSLHGLSWYASLLAQHAARLRRNRYDLLFASWGYPDAVGTRWLARRLGLPYVVKVHGSDLNVQATFLMRRLQIAAALRDARAVISVSGALRDKALELGTAVDRLHVIYNGVDGLLFHPGSQATARRALGLGESGRVLLYAGNLKVEKGCLDVLDALPRVLEAHPDGRLVIVGEGPARSVLTRRCADLGLDGRVTIAGAHPHPRLAEWMRAADVLCLPSHAEGVPNVVLEAMSSGLPVVASRVGGIPEVLPAFAGILHPARDVPALSQALIEAMSRDWDKPRITQHARGFNWEDNIRRLDGVLRAALDR